MESNSNMTGAVKVITCQQLRRLLRKTWGDLYCIRENQTLVREPLLYTRK